MDPVRTSIIIPTFNRASTVRRAIDSCLQQTSESFEIIVVDDGSTDNTPQVIRSEYSDEVRYIRYDENRGANFARTVGGAIANGKYASFLDSDDKLHPSHVEKVSQYLDEGNNCYAGVVVSNTRIKNGKKDGVRRIKDGSISSRDILDGEILNGFSSLTIKANVLRMLLPLDTKLPASQELDLYIRLAKQGHSLRGLEESLVDYHIEGSQISENIARRITGRKRILHKHSNDLTDSYCGELYYGLAFLYNKKNNMEECSNALNQAVKYNPTVKYRTHYIASQFGKNTFRTLLKLKESVSS